MGRPVAESNTRNNWLIPYFLIVMAAGSIAEAAATAWEKGNIVRFVVNFLASTSFLTTEQLTLFMVGVYVTLLVLLFLDPGNTRSVVPLILASVTYTVVLRWRGVLFRGTWEIVTDLVNGAEVLLLGFCVTLLVVKGHRELSRGVLDWNRRIVRFSLATLVASMTALVTIDVLINGQKSGSLLILIPSVMFLYFVGHALVERVPWSIVVLGPRRNGKTTFLVGLYQAYLEIGDGDPGPSCTSSWISKIKDIAPNTLTRTIDEHVPEKLQQGYVASTSGLRSYMARLRRIELVNRRPIRRPVNPTVPMSEMWGVLNDEDEEGWGTYELDRSLELGEPLPERMYVKIGFDVVSSEVFDRRIRLRTIDYSGDHYDDLPDMIEEYRGLLGWVRRYLARVLGEDLDEYGEYENEREFERVLARKIVSADAIVLVLEADHLVGEGMSDETAEGPKVSTREYNRKMRSVLEKLEETGPSRDVILAVTKVDRLRNRIDGASTSNLNEIVRERFEANSQLAELRNTVDDFSGIYAVCFEMKDDESGPVKPPETFGFRAALNSLVPGYE